MSKEKLNNLIDKVIGKVGPLRVPAYWMNKLFKDIGEWISKTEESITAVDSKIDKTKASIPTKVSQLENDEKYISPEYAETIEISTGNTAVIYDNKITYLKAPNDVVTVSIDNENEFHSGYLMLESPISGTDLTGMDILYKYGTDNRSGLYLIALQDISSNLPKIGEKIRIGDASNRGYLKVKIKTSNVKVVLFSTIPPNSEVYLNGKRIDDYRHLTTESYLTASHIYEIYYTGTIVFSGYRSSRENFDVELYSINYGSNNNLGIALYETNYSNISLLKSDRGVISSGGRVIMTDFIEGVEDLHFFGNVEKMIIPTTVKTATLYNNISKITSKEVWLADESKIWVLPTMSDTSTPCKFYKKKQDLLADIIVPEDKKEISCKGWHINSLKLHPGVNSIKNGGFANSIIKTLIIPPSFNEGLSFAGSVFDGRSSIEIFRTLGQNTDSSRPYWKMGDTLIKAGINISDPYLEYALNGVSVISYYAFSGCLNINKVISLPSGLLEILDSAFENTEIEEVYIPDTTVKLGDKSFSNCKNLSNITIGSGLKEVGRDCFRSTPSKNVYIKDLSAWMRISFKMLNGANTSSNPLQGGEGGHLFLNGTEIIDLVIPQDITGINGGAFAGAAFLQTVDIHSSVTRIYTAAFAGCGSIKQVIINGTIAVIERDTFYGCTSMIFYDFSNHTSIPALDNRSAFNRMPDSCKIVVPDILYDQWVAKTNWSVFADQIIKKSDWDAQQTTE